VTAQLSVEAPAASVASEQRGLPGQSWRVLFILTLVHIVYIMDRTVPSIVAESVKHEFDLSDGQVGLFTGLAYALSFAVMALLSGPLVDRFNRVRFLSLLLVLWSGLTALTSTAGSYIALLAMRFGVGASEAGGSPAALSLLSDAFPPKRRGIAVGIYKLGAPLGYFVASAGCGWVAAHYGWRAAFLVAGIPGLLLALAVLRGVPNLERGVLDHAHAGPRTAQPLRKVLEFLRKGPGVAFLILGLMAFGFASASVQAFLVPFLIRVHDMPLQEASAYYAAAAAVGAISPLLLGIFNDRLTAKGVQYALYLAAFVCLATGITGWIMVSAGSDHLVVVGLVLWQIFHIGLPAVSYATLLTLTPPAMRGTLVAVILTGTILVGIGIAPVAAGLISDALGGGTAIRYSLMIMLSVNLLAFLLYLLGGRQVAAAQRADQR